ncbi:Gfo/Idh/MocA family oxidoreductase [uncultured Pseudokineococcus sp.]|uniref:Gfo/Idh/MocA family protein n=1 Tax=uncultured Pseudokineococcus sp. TaxID=1642928 RepID=UPI00263615DE|nr:Gfo/Idh/MocA family oxidoreductase [uncultured Pseudokineococcus sp.]
MSAATQGRGLVLGVVGTGRIGAMHARNAVQTPGVSQVLLVDAAPEQAERVARSVGADAVGSVEELLGRVDGLVVAAATAAHPELVRAGVDAGLPVLCEKPVAPDVASSLPVLEHVAAAGGVVQMGHQRRLDAGYLEARRALRAGELGWLHSIRSVTCDAAPPPVAFLATSGGIFRDVSVHDFDVLRWLTGEEVVEVWARGSNLGDPEIGAVGDVDTALAVCTTSSGLLAVVTASRYNGAGHDVRTELQGSEGALVVGLDDRAALRSSERGVTFPAGPPHPTFAERFADAYRAELAAFCELVRGERENPCTPQDAVAASRVADAAQESLVTGRPVRVLG